MKLNPKRLRLGFSFSGDRVSYLEFGVYV